MGVGRNSSPHYREFIFMVEAGAAIRNLLLINLPLWVPALPNGVGEQCPMPPDRVDISAISS